MKIQIPADFDFALVQGFLAPRAVSGLEEAEQESYVRTLRTSEGVVTLSVRRRRMDGLEAKSAPGLPAERLAQLAAQLLDLNADLSAYRRRVADDTLLGPLAAKRPSLRIPQFLDPFEGLIRAILGQQVSIAAARTLTGRLIELCGDAAPPLDGRRLRAFPTAPSMVAAGPEKLARLGLTQAKAAALYAAAQAESEGRLDWDRLRRGTPEQAETVLTALRGVGPWTASYICMRCLGQRDAFPAFDLGVVKAVQAHLRLDRRPTRREVLERAEPWRPWRAYATMHLWHSLGGAD